MGRLLLLCLLGLGAAPGTSTAQTLNLITSDIENFWQAYDEPGNRTEAFQRLYFDRATPGLREFIRLRIGTAAQLAAAVERFPKYYASIRKATLSAEKQRAAMELYLSRFQGLLPEAKFPPVYLLVGRLSSGGTLGEAGLFIGTEVFSLSAEADVSELKELIPAFYRAMGNATKLAEIVVHELVHAQVQLRVQPPGMGRLLLTVLLEGAADFLTTQVTGRAALDSRSEYAQAHREELWRRLSADVVARPNETSGWLNNYGGAGEEPADLGYWLGEEICRDYVARAADKQQALANVATLRDPAAIVRGSNFAYLLSEP
jgi:hypothetical protein